MRSNREEYGNYQPSFTSSKRYRKTPFLHVDFLFASTVENTAKPFIYNGLRGFLIEEQRKEKRATTTAAECKNQGDHSLGKRCFLSSQGTGLKRTGNDEKTREGMGIIPLYLTNMVFRWSVRGIKKEPQTDLGLRFRILWRLKTERKLFRIRHFEHSGMNGCGWNHSILTSCHEYYNRFACRLQALSSKRLDGKR